MEPQERYMQQALEMALTHGITVYNSLYITQARGLKLLASDRVQLAVSEKLGVETLRA
ncbi:MAG: hypothetical protein QXJ21_04275 [Thermofilum sp.]